MVVWSNPGLGGRPRELPGPSPEAPGLSATKCSRQGCTMLSLETIRQALRCGEPGCACHKPNGHVHCPGHADSTPSLSVTEKDGKILVKCFGGCSQPRLIGALKEKGLWPSGNRNGRTKGKKELVATYPYRDAAGNLLFEVCKFRNPDGSKTFSQRRPLPGGG